MYSFTARFSVAIVIGLIFTFMDTAPAADDKTTPANEVSPANILSRDSLKNSRIRFEQSGKGHVAFIGGSITEMNGYRPMLMESLKRRFSKTEFTFTNAGISSTCSTTGAFRLQSDVLDKGPVDLLFIEFAVNDDQDAGHARRECLRGMEGILRHARQHNPQMDIVITYFVNEGILKTYGEKKTPLAISAQEEVADHYHVSTVHLAREVNEEIAAGKLTWAKYGGVHPAPFGNAICARMIDQLLDRNWEKPLAKNTKTSDYSLPEPLDPLSYSRGHFLDPKEAKIKNGWTLEIPDWKKIKGSTRERFAKIPLLSANEAGAEMSLSFKGTAIGAFVVAGPDAGIVAASIDDGPFQEVNLYHRYSAGLHYPRTVMFATDLAGGSHSLVLRTAEKTHSAGHSARIVQFVVNE